MSGVRQLSDDVHRRRWQFIGHIMRKEPNNDCRTALTWKLNGAESEGNPRPHGEGQWRRRGEEVDGDYGMMCAPWRQIEKAGDRILRPYVPLGTKRKGEDEGEGHVPACVHRDMKHAGSLESMKDA